VLGAWWRLLSSVVLASLGRCGLSSSRLSSSLGSARAHHDGATHSHTTVARDGSGVLLEGVLQLGDERVAREDSDVAWNASGAQLGEKACAAADDANGGLGGWRKGRAVVVVSLLLLLVWWLVLLVWCSRSRLDRCCFTAGSCVDH
jgi:hypothetical protein